jgi:hypothetical protein
MTRFSCVRALACLAVLAGLTHVSGLSRAASAQTSTAILEVRLDSARPPGTDTGAPVSVRLLSASDPARSWAAQLGSGEHARFRLLPPGNYRLIAGDVERLVELESGDEVTVVISREQQPPARPRDMRVSKRDRTAYGTRFNAAAIDMLPESNGVYGLIERSDPLVITERMEGGGAYPEPQRLGASGASWTQTTFRLGDADITDPDRTGYAMLYPNLDALEAVSVTTAGMHPDSYGSGTAVMLVPRMPSPTWRRTFQFEGSPPAFQSVNPLPDAASIGRLRSAAGGSFVISGPISDKLGIHLAGALDRSTRLERTRTLALASRTQSVSAHVVYKANERDEMRLFAQTDRLAFPVTGRAALVDSSLEQEERSSLLSATWDRHARSGMAWSANLSYAYGSGTPALAGTAVTGTMERLRDGPVYELAAAAPGRRHRTSLHWRGDSGEVKWLGLRHLPEFGGSASWTRAAREAPGSSTIGELVDNTPARVWQYSSDGASLRWGGVEAALWATNEIPITSRIDIDLGIRAATSSVSRDDNPATITWRALSPSIMGTYRAIGNGWLTFLAGYARYSSRLPLSYLAYGDPHALTGSVYRWNDLNQDRRFQSNEQGVRIAAVGPCCANGVANSIADDLRAPRTREVRAALQTRLAEHLVLRLGGTDRRSYGWIQPVNSAHRPSNFSLTHVEDPALDMLLDVDDQLLPIFNRLPASFATDSYHLQNVEHNSARDHGLDLVLERQYNGRWGMLIGATAHKSEGIGGNRGYRPDENDQGVLGEVFSGPNEETFARGRLFFERGYVIKWSAIYQLPYGLRGGTAARYQDGQHFNRVVLAPAVQQGLDFIPALPRGLTRYTYAFTLDTRLEKQLRAGTGRASVILDVFNLLNTNNEVEEDEVTGVAFRASTAVQPPRSVRLGIRVTF